MSDEYQRLTARLFDDSDKNEINPLAIFEAWLEQAKLEEINDANAMSLASVDSDGMPDVRVVLLKGWDEDGFVFYTNCESAKGQQLKDNPKAALLFYWKSLHRQVRVRGEVDPVSKQEADDYFATRPRGSQIGAYASAQSRPLERREDLLATTGEFVKKFDQTDVPRPGHWSGYRIKPLEIEFWKDGEFRLHDRVLFKREKPDAKWSRRRLNP